VSSRPGAHRRLTSTVGDVDDTISGERQELAEEVNVGGGHVDRGLARRVGFGEDRAARRRRTETHPDGDDALSFIVVEAMLALNCRNFPEFGPEAHQIPPAPACRAHKGPRTDRNHNSPDQRHHLFAKAVHRGAVASTNFKLRKALACSAQ